VVGMTVKLHPQHSAHFSFIPEMLPKFNNSVIQFTYMNQELPFFKRPKTHILIGMLLTVVIYIIATWAAGGWLVNLSTIFWNGLFCGLGFVLWFIFFAQFILPVKTLSDRWKLLVRLFLSDIPESNLLGLKNIHGPAIFIKDGAIIQSTVKSEGEVKEEIKKKGPGLIWLDPASAAVLRTPTKFTQAVGPGIVFTKRNETIASAIDLHIQRQSLGPKENEDPFAAKPEDMSEEKFKAIQDRLRWATSGMTRDGIEVVAAITVIFKIDADESRNEGGTPFGYNPDAVRKAVTSEAVNPNLPPENAQHRVAWNELPAFVAVDVWREYLRKFTLSQLFESVPPSTGTAGEEQTAIQFINDMLNERMKNSEVIVLDDFGRPTGKKAPSREYGLIKNSGIKILSVSSKKVYFSPSVEEQLISQWTAGWLEAARLERERVEQKRGLAAHAGREEAQKEFARRLSREVTRKSPEHPKEALEQLLQAARKTISRDPALYQRMGAELQEITEILHWLRGPA
jgi:hypothetical protein